MQGNYFTIFKKWQTVMRVCLRKERISYARIAAFG